MRGMVAVSLGAQDAAGAGEAPRAHSWSRDQHIWRRPFQADLDLQAWRHGGLMSIRSKRIRKGEKRVLRNFDISPWAQSATPRETADQDTLPEFSLSVCLMEEDTQQVWTQTGQCSKRVLHRRGSRQPGLELCQVVLGRSYTSVHVFPLSVSSISVPINASSVVLLYLYAHTFNSSIYFSKTCNFSHIFSGSKHLSCPDHTGFRRDNLCLVSLCTQATGGHLEWRLPFTETVPSSLLVSLGQTKGCSRLFQTIPCYSRLSGSSRCLSLLVKNPVTLGQLENPPVTVLKTLSSWSLICSLSRAGGLSPQWRGGVVYAEPRAVGQRGLGVRPWTATRTLPEAPTPCIP